MKEEYATGPQSSQPLRWKPTFQRELSIRRCAQRAGQGRAGRLALPHAAVRVCRVLP